MVFWGGGGWIIRKRGIIEDVYEDLEVVIFGFLKSNKNRGLNVLCWICYEFYKECICIYSGCFF